MKAHSFVVTRLDSGKTLAAMLRSQLKMDWKEVRALVRGNQVQLNGKPCRKPTYILQRGQKIIVQGSIDRKALAKDVRQKQIEAQDLGPKPVVRFSDKHIVVVDKPAGVTTVRHKKDRESYGRRSQKFLPTTLVDLVSAQLLKTDRDKVSRLRAIHRLDRETTGLVVMARTAEAESLLGKQLRELKFERKYLALVRGEAKTERIETRLVDDRGDHRRGSATKPGAGKPAVTMVRVLERLGPYTLVECTLETGRTHQVRIHLGERGTPLCGERVYDRPLHGSPLPDESEAERPMLHASCLGLTHPISGKSMRWTAPLPDDMKQLLQKLRRQFRAKS